jgi:MFS family permease
MEAGIQLLPYSLGSSLASMPAAWIIQHVQQKRQDTLGQKAVMFTGLLLATLGFGTRHHLLTCLFSNQALGLMHLMTTNSTIGLQVAIALIAGIGIGALFHAPYQVFSNRHSHDLASITGAFFLVRFTGSTVGLVSVSLYVRKAARQLTQI